MLISSPILWKGKRGDKEILKSKGVMAIGKDDRERPIDIKI